MQAFQTALQPSKRLTAAAVAAHFAALVLCIAAFYGAMMWLGLAALAASAAHAWRVVRLRHKDAVRTIEVDRFCRAKITLEGGAEPQAAVLGGASMIAPYALFLQWDTGQGKVWQCVLPDMMPSESYRRLRVWARWCQTQNPTPPDAADAV